MSIPTKFEGTVFFTWDVKEQRLMIGDYEFDSAAYIPMGSLEVAVPLDIEKATVRSLDALDEAIKEEREKSTAKIVKWQELRQSLLAIESAA